MSLILHLEQGQNKLNRVLYFPNNIAEIIHSDGITFNEAMKDMGLEHPFYRLSDSYEIKNEVNWNLEYHNLMKYVK